MKALVLVLALALVPDLSAQQQPPQEEVQVVAQSARLRATASTQSAVVATAVRGTKLSVIGRDGGWLYVRFGEKRGFIAASLVIPITPTPTSTSTAPPRPAVPVAPTAPPPQPQPPPVVQSPAPADRAFYEDRPSRKEPGTATLVSVLITGGGQIYAGDTRRGLMMMAGSVGAVVTGSILSGGASCGINSCTSGSYTPLYLGALAAVGIWVYSIIDAAPTTRRMNARNGFQVARLAPMVGSEANGTSQFGLQLRF
jgi:hypothetical protein